MSGPTRYRAAVTAQLILLAYFELCILIPLGKWNAHPVITLTLSDYNISDVGRAGAEVLAAAMGGAQLLLLVGTIRRLKALLWFGLVGDTVWLLLHIQNLWIPYIYGASPNYAYMYYQIYGSSTTNLLPNFRNHLAPDGMHTLFDVFMIAVIVTLVLYLRSLRRQRSSIQRPPQVGVSGYT